MGRGRTPPAAPRQTPGPAMLAIGGRMRYLRNTSPPRPPELPALPPPPPAVPLRDTEERLPPLANRSVRRPRRASAGLPHHSTRAQRRGRCLELRVLLPELNHREVRRYRRPLHETVVLELKEDGYRNSADFIAGLLRLEQSLRAEASPCSALLQNPQLRDQPRLLYMLRDSLVMAEKAMRRQPRRFKEEASWFTELGLAFARLPAAYWWVAEQLLQTAVRHSALITDGGRGRANAHYIMGKFLLENLDEAGSARKHLEESRQLCAGKNWPVEECVGRAQDTLYHETCTLLTDALLKLAQQTQPEKPQKALSWCSQALRRATDSHLPQCRQRVLLQLGACYQALGMQGKALQSLGAYIHESRTVFDAEGLCEAYLESAVCYKAMGDIDKTTDYLRAFLQTAVKYNLKKHAATAHRFLAESLLANNEALEANDHLEKSFRIYMDLRMWRELDQVRVLAAVAKGKQIMPHVVGILDETVDYARNPSFDAWMNWKMSHKPFWDTAEGPQLPPPDLYTQEGAAGTAAAAAPGRADAFALGTVDSAVDTAVRTVEKTRFKTVFAETPSAYGLESTPHSDRTPMGSVRASLEEPLFAPLKDTTEEPGDGAYSVSSSSSADVSIITEFPPIQTLSAAEAEFEAGAGAEAAAEAGPETRVKAEVEAGAEGEGGKEDHGEAEMGLKDSIVKMLGL